LAEKLAMSAAGNFLSLPMYSSQLIIHRVETRELIYGSTSVLWTFTASKITNLHNLQGFISTSFVKNSHGKHSKETKRKVSSSETPAK
jgi:hypothetical protein